MSDTDPVVPAVVTTGGGPVPPSVDRRVAVIGAGPVGLAAAAHLAERGIATIVLEAGDSAGAAVRQWGHVRLFSPWRHLIDPAARRLLAAGGWVEPDPEGLPTGAELVQRYLEPLAATEALAPSIHYRSRVTAITRDGFDRVRSRGRERAPFLIRLDDGRHLLARAVIDASGTWSTPNVLGASGIPAVGEAAASAAVAAPLPDVLGADRHHHAGRHTLVVGSGHSAANTLQELVALAESEPATTVSWAIRTPSPDRSYGGGADDALPARGRLGAAVRALVEQGRVRLLADFAVEAIEPVGGQWLVTSRGGGQKVAVDRIVAATGFRPDHGIAAELRLELDPLLGATRALAPLIDPNEHSCGTVPPHGVDQLSHPEVGYYAIGMKSYGRAPTFLLATGYEQARSVVAALAGDWAAAREVRLELPQTGVCSSGAGATSSCC